MTDPNDIKSFYYYIEGVDDVNNAFEFAQLLYSGGADLELLSAWAANQARTRLQKEGRPAFDGFTIVILKEQSPPYSMATVFDSSGQAFIKIGRFAISFTIQCHITQIEDK